MSWRQWFRLTRDDVARREQVLIAQEDAALRAARESLAIKELAGHTSVTTTMRYMHVSPSAKSAAIELLNREARGAVRETAHGS